jgi:hypothetical protein
MARTRQPPRVSGVPVDDALIVRSQDGCLAVDPAGDPLQFRNAA